MKVKYKSPTPISKVRKDVIGDFKPLFGTGTGAGDIKCPLCYTEIGHLMVYPEITMDTDLDQATVVGEVNEHHEGWKRKCSFEHKMPNLSDVQVRDLMVGVRPKGMLPMDYEDKVTGPGMVYRYDDRKREGVWILDNYEYSTYLYARGRELLKDIGSRYGTLVDSNGKPYEYIMTTFGGATMYYKDALEGCNDWYEYIMDVISDCPDAYEPKQIDTLHRIHEYLEKKEKKGHVV